MLRELRRPPPPARRSGRGRRRSRRRRRSCCRPRRRRAASRSMPSLESTAIASRTRLAQRGDARQLGGVDHLVADVDVVDAGGGERLRLARLLHADADRAGLPSAAARCVALLCILACGRRRTPWLRANAGHAWRGCAPSRRGRSRAPACRSTRPGRRPAAAARQRSSRRPARAVRAAAALMSPPAARSGNRLRCRRRADRRRGARCRSSRPA